PRQRVAQVCRAPAWVSFGLDPDFSIVPPLDGPSRRTKPADRRHSPAALQRVPSAARSVPLRAAAATRGRGPARPTAAPPAGPLRYRRTCQPHPAATDEEREPGLRSHEPGHYSCELLLNCPRAASVRDSG